MKAHLVYMWGILPAVIFSHVVLFLDFGLVSVINHFRFLTVCVETVMWSQWRNVISTVDVTYRFGKPKSPFLSRLSNEVAEAWSLVEILHFFHYIFTESESQGSCFRHNLFLD